MVQNLTSSSSDQCVRYNNIGDALRLNLVTTNSFDEPEKFATVRSQFLGNARENAIRNLQIKKETYIPSDQRFEVLDVENPGAENSIPSKRNMNQVACIIVSSLVAMLGVTSLISSFAKGYIQG